MNDLTFADLKDPSFDVQVTDDGGTPAKLTRVTYFVFLETLDQPTDPDVPIENEHFFRWDHAISAGWHARYTANPDEVDSDLLIKALNYWNSRRRAVPAPTEVKRPTATRGRTGVQVKTRIAAINARRLEIDSLIAASEVTIAELELEREGLIDPEGAK